MTPTELQRQAVELLDCLSKETISPRKRFELANVVKRQASCFGGRQDDRDIASNLNYLHNHISKALKAFPKLKDMYPAALTLLSEMEESVRQSTGEFTHPEGKSGL